MASCPVFRATAIPTVFLSFRPVDAQVAFVYSWGPVINDFADGVLFCREDTVPTSLASFPSSIYAEAKRAFDIISQGQRMIWCRVILEERF